VNAADTIEYPDETGLMILPWVSLFPGAMMPLKIFEERYQEMLRASLAGNRMFAIAHTVQEEWECDSLGAIGMIRACVQNEDGSSNLVLQGVSRVQFCEMDLAPYPSGRIAVLSDPDETSPELECLRKKIQSVFKSRAKTEFDIPQGYVDHLDKITRHGALTDMIASTVIENPESRRLLLEELDIPVRMEMLLALLHDAKS